MTKQPNTYVLPVFVVLAIMLGLAIGSVLFPQTEVVIKEIPFEVEKEIIVTEAIPFDYSTMMGLCPVCESTEATVITETITPVDQIDIAWQYILDNWKDGDEVTVSEEDFDELFETCERESYKLDEIEWDIQDECKYIIQDYDKNKYKLVFWVEAEYNNECENKFEISVEYYKNRDPSYEIVLL